MHRSIPKRSETYDYFKGFDCSEVDYVQDAALGEDYWGFEEVDSETVVEE